MSIIKRLAGQTAIYGISSILGRAINYVLVPLHTYLFNTAQYGIISEFYAYVAFLNILFIYGMETAFFRFANKEGTQITFNNAVSSIILSSALLAGIIVFQSEAIAAYLEYPSLDHIVEWLAILIALDAVAAIPFAALRHFNKPGKFATVRLINIGLNVGFNVFFLILCRDIHQGDYLQSLQPFINSFYNPELSIGYVFLANLLANAIMLLMLLPVFKGFRFRFQWSLLKSMLRYSFPLLFMGLAGMVNEVIDRILLKEFLPQDFYPGKTSQDAVGIYSACYKLAIFMTISIQAFRYAADPLFFSKAEDKEAPETFANIMKWFIIAAVFILIAVSMNLDVLGMLLRRPGYREGLMIVPVLLLANLMLGVFYNLSVWYKLTDRTQYGLYLSGGGAVLTIVFNILLIPHLGYWGSAWTTLISYTSMALASYLLSKKFFPVPYPLGRIGLYLILGLAMVIVFLSISWPNLLSSILARSVMITGYIYLVFHWEQLKLPLKKRRE